MKLSLAFITIAASLFSYETFATEEQAPAKYSACGGCHATGAAGAPKPGDDQAWADRINRGMNTLVDSVKAGKGMMHPMGLCDCTDDQLKSIIQYMAFPKEINSAKAKPKTLPSTKSIAPKNTVSHGEVSEDNPLTVYPHEYTPLDYYVLSKTPLRGDLSTKNSLDSFPVRISNIQTVTVRDVKYNGFPAQELYLASSNQQCGVGIHLWKVKPDGELIYFVKNDSECFPGLLYVELTFDDELKVIAALKSFDGTDLHRGQVNNKEFEEPLKKITSEQVQMNRKLVDNFDEYMGFWSGEVDGEKVEFSLWSLNNTLSSRKNGSSIAAIHMPDSGCNITVRMIKSRRINSWDEESESMPAYIKKLNSLSRTLIVHDQSGRCDDSKYFSRMTSTKSPSFEVSLISDRIAEITYKYNMNYKASPPTYKVANGRVTKKNISQSMSRLLNSREDTKSLLASSAADYLKDSTINYETAWYREKSKYVCGGGIFCRFPGGNYLSALYEGDLDRIETLESTSDMYGRKLVLDELLAEYLHNYEAFGSACLKPDAVRKSYSRTETRGYDKWETNVIFVFNKEFQPICNDICGNQSVLSLLPLGPVLMREVSTGLLNVMEEYQCSSAEIKQLERNMIDIYYKLRDKK